jgi:hypothetical protein
MNIFVSFGVSEEVITFLEADGHQITMAQIPCREEQSIRSVLAHDLAAICAQCDGVAVVQGDDNRHPAHLVGRALGLVILVFPKSFSVSPHAGI